VIGFGVGNNDARVLNLHGREEKLRADRADVRLLKVLEHALDPIRSDRLDVVVQ
jgi:hypothetical protein